MKAILIGLMIVIMQSALFAQRLMPRVGSTVPVITFDNNFINHYSKINFLIGLGYELPINQKFFVQPEISFVGKGGKFSSTNYYRSNLTLYYIEATSPIKFKIGLPKIAFYLLASPVFGICVDGRYSVRIRESYQMETFNVQFKPYPESGGDDLRFYSYVDHRYELGFQLGAGIELFNHLIVDVRYQQGLTELYSKKNRGDHDPIDIKNAKNQLWQFCIIVPFRFKGDK